jgi:hypothetical protein
MERHEPERGEGERVRCRGRLCDAGRPPQRPAGRQARCRARHERQRAPPNAPAAPRRPRRAPPRRAGSRALRATRHPAPARASARPRPPARRRLFPPQAAPQAAAHHFSAPEVEARPPHEYEGLGLGRRESLRGEELPPAPHPEGAGAAHEPHARK